MRLCRVSLGVFFMLGVLTFSAPAYDYPVLGEYNVNYEKVFNAIKAGRCASMDTEAEVLSVSEGISKNIYIAICYFENNDNDSGFKVLDKMLENQEYDEALYVCNSLDKKGSADARIKKYKGIIHYNIGDLYSALEELTAYLKINNDPEVRYNLSDVLVSMQRLDEADSILDGVVNKTGSYYIRKGRLAMRKARFTDAYDYFSKVKPEETNIYARAQMLLGDVCFASGKFLCANEAYNNVKGTEQGENAAEKLSKMQKSRKNYGFFISFNEEYDNNVTAIEEDEMNGISKEESFRSSVAADAKLIFYPSRHLDRMSIGVFNYKSWNHSISSYDMSNHKIYVQGRRFFGNLLVMPKLNAGITYFDGDKYSYAYSLETNFQYKTDDYTLTFPVKIAYKDYLSDSSEGDNDKDGMYYSVTAKAEKEFKKKYSAEGYVGYEFENTKGSEKEAKDYQWGFELGMKILPPLKISYNFDFTYFDYFSSTTDRGDNYFTTGIKGVYRFHPSAFLTLGVAYTKNDSSDDVYDYKKTVFNTSVSYMY